MKLSESNKLSYSYFFLYSIFFILVFVNKLPGIQFENIDIDAIIKITNPNFPKGGLLYDPHFHFNYIVVYFSNFLGLDFNSKLLAGTVWFIEQSFTISSLFLLSKLLFKKNYEVFIYILFIYILIKSGESDQKTFLRPFLLLSIYFFLKSKYLLFSIFSGLIFYLHIGWGIWWFLPSSFAILLIYFFERNIKNFFNALFYPLITLIVSSPIIIFYIFLDNTFTSDEFFKNYWYGVNNSIIEVVFNNQIQFFYYLSTVLIVLLGYSIFKKQEKNSIRKENILYLLFGVCFVFIISFIFVDYLKFGTVIKLQLLRSFELVTFFSFIFLGYILYNQVNRGNYIFVFLFFIISVPNPFWLIHRFVSYYNLLYAFYLIIFTYEYLIYNKYLYFPKLLNLRNLNHRNFFIILIILYFSKTFLSLSGIEDRVKNFIIGSDKNTIYSYEEKKKFLFSDINNFIDKNLFNKNNYFIIPFYETDFAYLSKNKNFINQGTMYDYIPINHILFKDVVLDDFQLSASRIKNTKIWLEIWTNLDENMINLWKKKYALTHLIREKSFSKLNFKIIYENEKYYIYEL